MIHPAKTITYVWCGATFLLLILPFHLTLGSLTLYGGIMELIFLLLFVIGTILGSRFEMRPLIKSEFEFDRLRAYKILMGASIFAIAFFLIDLSEMSLDLSSAYNLRSEAASGLLKAESSNSSIWFKLGFLLYPAGYVYVSVYMVYENKIDYLKIFVFGLLPVIMASIVMGGRMPLCFLLVIVWLAWHQRKEKFKFDRMPQICSRRRRFAIYTIIALVLLLLFYYFIAVFLARAESAGGAETMLKIAEDSWGVSFDGSFSRAIEEIFGPNVLYLVFVFFWYLVQGVVMANFVLTDYAGPWMYGAYGVDIISALVRHLDPVALRNGFSTLLDLGVYGFFPSAWGSMHVDFGWSALFLTILWGAFAGLGYRRIVLQRSQRWFFIAPFITSGIIFSLINTPLGVSNGFVVYSWVLLIFFLLNESQIKR